ncbi:NADH-quinone oxidoreductase subunit L [Thalassomonas actiniarum]|uniref:NADH-quinone oxidoreductase subunit L n=1 Tax=Thalassomonas actiniarum TaxID=485447 RepID=A0AAE9YW23_9GAMM|nr:NADH-quinone oxidoreductase subunit L [Thalassomonas actiniarum]WDE00617.1 NADH-quinone oxidoreductase subunit L [Thalassomonas actiniarum]
MSLLAWIPFYPLVSFLILIALGKRLSWGLASTLSVGAIALSAISSALVISQLASADSGIISVKLWSWFSLGGGEVNFSFYLDSLSAVMISVVSGVGLLIHAYAAAYMKNDENFSRFMAYMNLFIVAMLILVLADNLVLLYLGWEGVGLCSFLLIGFWYQEKENVLAARKAFIVTRVGDTAMAIGLFLLFKSLGELNIVAVNASAHALWQIGDELPYWIALLLLGGAVGKSAQLPLQTWLPDAMAGPTPVSALIHAATMVTAGVYLIARMQGVFLLSPEVMSYVAWIGALTLLLAGVAALAQKDIKRVLAYSTMSQIGYMMLALGAGAWSAGVFHLMTHAFFKALLFLTAGSVILALHHQQDLFKMGGLLKKLPVESGLFIVGLICLMALPGTSGFFSKEAIIATLWSSPTAGPVLWWGAILGALLTSIYSCRLFFLAFLGASREHDKVHDLHHDHPSVLLRWPLFLLALLSLFGGLISLDFTEVFSVASSADGVQEPAWLHSLAIATPFIGIAFAWFFFKSYRDNNGEALEMKPGGLNRFCGDGLGFDWLYHYLLVRPYCFLANINRRDVIDQLLMFNGWYVRLWHDALSASQNGSLRWYAAGIGLAVVCLAGVITL